MCVIAEGTVLFHGSLHSLYSLGPNAEVASHAIGVTG